MWIDTDTTSEQLFYVKNKGKDFTYARISVIGMIFLPFCIGENWDKAEK